MQERRRFRKSLGELKKKDFDIAKMVICKKCYWSTQLFGMKADGLRPLTDYNAAKVDEFQVVETVLRTLGIEVEWEFIKEFTS